MFDRTSYRIIQALFALLALLLLAGQAHAYIVPGPGPEFLGQFLGLVMWLIVAFSSLLLWPVYALLRYARGAGALLRGARAPSPEAPPAEGAGKTAPALHG